MLLVMLVSAGGCVAAAPAPKELTVFAASSLTEPLREVAPGFAAAHGGASVVYSFGGTPQLRTQLEQGARADVFVSANREQMEAARQSGVVVGEAPAIARNRLVVIAGRASGVERLEELARPGVRLVITQGDVPIGTYTRAALRRMAADPRYGAEYVAKVLANVRSEEPNVKQLVAKVQLGEADAAWVYASDASSIGPDVRTIAVPDEFNTVAEYPAAVVKDARNPDLARAYLAYLLAEPGQEALRQHGFVVGAPGG